MKITIDRHSILSNNDRTEEHSNQQLTHEIDKTNINLIIYLSHVSCCYNSFKMIRLKFFI